MAKGKILKIFIDYLANEGAKLIKVGLDTREYTHRTKNLKDSYGSAVYYNGALQRDSIRTITPEAIEPRRWYGEDKYGAEEIKDFFDNYTPQGKGIQLVVAVAMPYASILENGEGHLRRKYRVISGIVDDLESLANKYHATVKKL